MVSIKNNQCSNCEKFHQLIFDKDSSEESDDDLVPEIRSFMSSNNDCSKKSSYLSNSFEEGKPIYFVFIFKLINQSFRCNTQRQLCRSND